MKVGDKVTFKVHGKEFHYELTNSFLQNSDDHFSNKAIFTELGYDDTTKYVFCEEAYGYKPEPGNCPTCHPGDMAALTRLVEAIKRICSPFGEIVEFIIGDRTFKYEVHSAHLSGQNCSNDAIFKDGY